MAGPNFDRSVASPELATVVAAKRPVPKPRM